MVVSNRVERLDDSPTSEIKAQSRPEKEALTNSSGSLIECLPEDLQWPDELIRITNWVDKIIIH